MFTMFMFSIFQLEHSTEGFQYLYICSNTLFYKMFKFKLLTTKYFIYENEYL